MNDPLLVDRAHGLLVGMAIGDALGAPVEFDLPEHIRGRREELMAMPGGGAFDWAPGEFTDDTQMALVLARHLRAHQGRIAPQVLAEQFADWASDAADVGNQTRRVLNAVRAGAPWEEAVAVLAPDAAGNGSLMRVAPVALAAPTAARASALALEQSLVTHPNDSCQQACALVAALLWELLEGELPPLDELASRAALEPVRQAVEGAASFESPPMSGWVLHTLTGALWATQTADRFEDAVWRAVALGHDADTVGAVAGAIAGARWGLSGIPSTLAERLQSRHRLFVGEYPGALLDLAEELLALRALQGPSHE
jgi:ADP-ribosyl-[dinitrogen reductase] hydrolase